ncbi:glutamate-tRNA ligase [Cylindrobasidium torrendii FP15055 ss-10]|uniref:glutamate--tRNA ligase n=1 Tax=Cylindrobasidium torrendii FP15055 ss-10 TaxID=1314674 RepID=A0A0D7BSH9_9AGAR|nr:glutamate-tRNA ligase [Cylindrobasidium torrendii FP15055 ss-10]
MALKLSAKTSPFPYAIAAAATLSEKAELVFDENVSSPVLELNGSTITDGLEIVKALVPEGDSLETASLFSVAKELSETVAVPQITAALDSLDDRLAWRTYLVSHQLTAADIAVWGAVKGNVKILGLLKNNRNLHLSRWYSHIESLEFAQAVAAALASAKASKARSTKVAAGFSLGLEGAEMGKVVTRFPPEPSGYLHIGHAKAAMLNQYFAKMYEGKLIIRFDDTNPSKETTEFEDTILEDLHLLDVKADVITHTSDYFEQLHQYAIKAIKDGKAYADDTLQEQMRKERWDGIASRHREDSVEDNLKHFDEMFKGSEEGVRWCLRAKLSVDDPNKALRDPVIYRCNLLPHHRTGDKWKVYPTYDFACPIVDSIEGVTHALRTNEYRDRNPQYWWMTDAVGLRKVRIWDFSRLNFIYTLLSKRKLHQFVNSGAVRGWDDPRFPTVRGIRRRGMTVDALRQFMLLQGPSQAIVSLEWDSIWALNKKVIDPIAPRHWAITNADKVPVTISGGPSGAETKTLPKHKKNPDVGEKKTVYSSNIWVDQEDAKSFDDQEEVTLMDWGNAFVRSKTVDESGKVTAISMDLHLDGDFKKTKKKITWLAQEGDLIPVTLLDYDYLITKKKLEEDDDVKDFATPVTEFKEDALADANVQDLKKGDYMQFERKGYYIYDGEGQYIKIPDGRAAGIASKADEEKPKPKPKPKAEKAPKGKGKKAEPQGEKVNDLKMYKVDSILKDEVAPDVSGLKMYQVDSIHN